MRVLLARGAAGRVLAAIGVVIDLLDETAAAEARAGQALLAPERGLVHGVHLDDQAHGDVLVRDLLLARHRRLEGDAAVEVRRDGQDRVAGVHLVVVSERHDVGGGAVVRHAVAHVCGHPVLLVRGGRVRLGPAQGAHRLAEDDVVAQLGGHGQGHGLHAALDALVQDEVLVHQVPERPGRGGHEQRLEHGEGVGGLGQHAGGDVDGDVVDGLRVVGLLLQPVAEGDLVQLGGPRVLPRGGGVDLGGQFVDLGDQAIHLPVRLLGHREVEAVVDVAFSARVHVDVATVAEAGERRQAELLHQGDEAGLVRGDPLAADLDEVVLAVSALDQAVPGAAADAPARLQDGDGQALGLRGAGGHEAGRAGADHDDVARPALAAGGGGGGGHGVLLWRGRGIGRGPGECRSFRVSALTLRPACREGKAGPWPA